ncbi:hypothetical protein BRC75_00700, partial [Halobacteriales archaeon QH_7_69_31]
ARADDRPAAGSDTATSSDAADTGDASPDDLEPAVVPLGAGELSVPTDRAVVPLADADRPWSDPAATNGDDAVVPEAEPQ